MNMPLANGTRTLQFEYDLQTFVATFFVDGATISNLNIFLMNHEWRNTVKAVSTIQDSMTLNTHGEHGLTMVQVHDSALEDYFNALIAPKLVTRRIKQ